MAATDYVRDSCCGGWFSAWVKDDNFIWRHHSLKIVIILLKGYKRQ